MRDTATLQSNQHAKRPPCVHAKSLGLAWLNCVATIPNAQHRHPRNRLTRTPPSSAHGEASRHYTAACNYSCSLSSAAAAAVDLSRAMESFSNDTADPKVRAAGDLTRLWISVPSASAAVAHERSSSLSSVTAAPNFPRCSHRQCPECGRSHAPLRAVPAPSARSPPQASPRQASAHSRP